LLWRFNPKEGQGTLGFSARGNFQFAVFCKDHYNKILTITGKSKTLKQLDRDPGERKAQNKTTTPFGD
jgi:hypothetical protein